MATAAFDIPLGLGKRVLKIEAGTAADTEAVTDMVSSQLQLHRYQTGRRSRVVTALTLQKDHLCKHQGYVQAALVLGGVDFTGPHLHTGVLPLIYPHGSVDTLPFATMDSCSLAAMVIFESKYREGLTGSLPVLFDEEMKEYSLSLRLYALLWDRTSYFVSRPKPHLLTTVGTGSQGHKECLRNHLLPNPRTYVGSKGYSFPKKTGQ
ncbi:hypothetical protein SLEP1_g19553 [Rubroshorea leprosula]|uniref:Uncharacterized protein n=1 Tax=Rubroshorea leprosula TaxID=152421 RepID=A0AAV5JAC2_9ROSI|nr:hypothetical protein SLEP1_g19553 [Rubroshorea leprosula]